MAPNTAFTGKDNASVDIGRVLLAVSVGAVICLEGFVVIGRGSHGIGSGLSWFFTVLWPFLAGWFAVAVVVRLYTAGSKPWLRLGATWSLGVAAALVLRAVFTHRESLSTFTIVAYVQNIASFESNDLERASKDFRIRFVHAQLARNEYVREVLGEAELLEDHAQAAVETRDHSDLIART